MCATYTHLSTHFPSNWISAANENFGRVDIHVLIHEHISHRALNPETTNTHREQRPFNRVSNALYAHRCDSPFIFSEHTRNNGLQRHHHNNFQRFHSNGKRFTPLELTEIHTMTMLITCRRESAFVWRYQSSGSECIRRIRKQSKLNATKTIGKK